MVDHSTSAKASPFRRLTRWIANLCGIGLLLLVILAVIGVVFRDPLLAKTDEIVRAQLARRGIYADYAFVDLTLLRGLQFADIALFRDPEKTDTMFALSDAAIFVSPLALLGGADAKALLTIRGGVISLLVDDDRAPLHISDVNADLWLGRSDVALQSFEAHFQGLDIECSGDLTFSKGAPGEKPEGVQKDRTPFRIAEIDWSPAQRIAEWMQFQREKGGAAPRLKLELVRRGDDSPLTFDGSLRGDAFIWRAAAFDHLEAVFSGVAGGGKAVFRFDPLEFGYDGRTFGGEFAYETKLGRIDFREATSSIDLLGFFAKVAPGLGVGSLHRIRLEPPPEISGSGQILPGNLKHSSLALAVGGENGMEVSMDGGHVLAFSDVACNVTLNGGTLGVENLKSGFLGGNVSGSATLSPFGKPVEMYADLSCQGLSLDAIALFADYKKGFPGSVDVTFQGGGKPSLAGLDGVGRFEIADSAFRSIPVFRSLLPLFEKMIPGFQGNETTTLRSSYALTGGVFSTEDLVVDADTLEILASSEIDLVKRKLHVIARANTGDVTSRFTALAGKALEIEGDGSFGEFDWEFKNIPGLKTMGDLVNLGVEESLTQPRDGAVNGTGTITEGVRETAAAAGKTAGKTLDILEQGGKAKEKGRGEAKAEAKE